MLKQTVLCLCMSLLFSSITFAAAPPAPPTHTAGDMEWSTPGTWNIPGKPLDVAVDSRGAFILADDAKIYLFNGNGQQLGSVPVDVGTSAMKIIAQRTPDGKIFVLFLLLNQKTHTYSVLSITDANPQTAESAATPLKGPLALQGNVLESWPLPVMPLDMVIDSKQIFLLGEDAKIYIFTPHGEQLSVVPVPAGTNGFKITAQLGQEDKFLLINQETKTCSILSISFKDHLDNATDPPKYTLTDVKATSGASWNVPAKPVDLVVDNKRIFVLGDDAKIYIYDLNGKKINEIPVDAGVTGLRLIDSGNPHGDVFLLLNTKNKTYTALHVTFQEKVNIAGAPVRGKNDAPVTIVVFSDFQCPWCGKLEPTLEQLFAKNPNTIRMVFKHLPLNNIHPFAKEAALAALAAQRQGKFWEMHDALFATQVWTPTTVVNTAKAIGLNMKKFHADMKSKVVQKQLEQDMADAKTADVSATPCLFINGKPVSGQPLDKLQAIVDQAAAGVKK